MKTKSKNPYFSTQNHKAMSETFNQPKKQVHGLLKRKLSIVLIMSKIILFLLISICSLQLYSQTEREIVINEYRCVLFWSGYTFNFNNYNSNYLEIINDSNYLVITFQDSLKNNVMIQQYNVYKGKDTVMIAKSSFFNSQDTLCHYVSTLNEDGSFVGYTKRKYFQFLPNGESLFWNQKNKLRRRDYWDKGALIKTENFE